MAAQSSRGINKKNIVSVFFDILIGCLEIYNLE